MIEPAIKPEFISIPEWARRPGISPESAYKAARLGEIPGCFSIGRLYRVNWPVFDEATSWMRSVAERPIADCVADQGPLGGGPYPRGPAWVVELSSLPAGGGASHSTRVSS